MLKNYLLFSYEMSIHISLTQFSVGLLLLILECKNPVSKPNCVSQIIVFLRRGDQHQVPQSVIPVLNYWAFFSCFSIKKNLYFVCQCTIEKWDFSLLIILSYPIAFSDYSQILSYVWHDEYIHTSLKMIHVCRKLATYKTLKSNNLEFFWKMGCY